jgi:hypothetical protein
VACHLRILWLRLSLPRRHKTMRSMARLTKQPRPLLAFKHPVRIEVYRPEFDLFTSVAHLNITKLARAARAEIELGTLKTSCCSPIVCALIRKGMVTELRVNPCPEGKSEPLTPECIRLLNLARRRARQRRSGPGPLPMPVAKFMSVAQEISTETLNCFSVCLFGHCLICCHIQSTDRWVCSTIGIVVKPPKQ